MNISFFQVTRINSPVIIFLKMGRGKGLSEEERNIIIKEIAKGKPQSEVAAQIGRHVKTIKRFFGKSEI